MSRLSRLKNLLVGRTRLKARKGRWIQVIAKVEPHWANRRSVAYSNAQGVGNVIKVTLLIGTLLAAKLGRPLFPMDQAVKHVMPGIKNVTCIVEHGKA